MVTGGSPEQKQRRTRGFTLTELLVALGVAAVLAAIAVPSFQILNYTTKRSSVVNDLIAAMQYARGEAVKRGRQVVVCSGTSACGGATDWASGWIVFENMDRDNPPVIDGGETILKKGVAAPAKITITTTATFFAYEPFNTRMGAGDTMTVCTPLGASEARAIIVSSGTRRARSSSTKSDGSPLVCPTA